MMADGNEMEKYSSSKQAVRDRTSTVYQLPVQIAVMTSVCFLKNDTVGVGPLDG
jgi:hypothetical protein